MTSLPETLSPDSQAALDAWDSDMAAVLTEKPTGPMATIRPGLLKIYEANELHRQAETETDAADLSDVRRCKPSETSEITPASGEAIKPPAFEVGRLATASQTTTASRTLVGAYASPNLNYSSSSRDCKVTSFCWPPENIRPNIRQASARHLLDMANDSRLKENRHGS
ncbi:MAG: hypothetical protein ACREGA_04410 [Candidatus Saccharimonadales bacterium]